jgi:hypothetical protein
METKTIDNGFVSFPKDRNHFNITDGLTTINIVAFDPNQLSNYKGNDSYILSNGMFICDDIQSRGSSQNTGNELDKSLGQYMDGVKWSSIYFPDEDDKSIPMFASVCVGWIDNIFEKNEGYWNCTFDELTHNGKELYFLMKKLHYEKEVRILTFVKNY